MSRKRSEKTTTEESDDAWVDDQISAKSRKKRPRSKHAHGASAGPSSVKSVTSPTATGPKKKGQTVRERLVRKLGVRGRR